MRVEESRPRANSEPVANYGSIFSPSEEAKFGRALRVIQAEPISVSAVGDEKCMLPLLDAPSSGWFATSAIVEEDEDQSTCSEKSTDLIVTDKAELEMLTGSHELPVQLGTETMRRVWSFFSLYRLIFTFILVVNIMSLMFAGPLAMLTSSDAATASAINLCVAILFRNEHVVNIVFRLACALRPSTPLAVRKIGGKAYSYGGFHSGCATAGTMWYLIFTVLLATDFHDPHKRVVFSLAVAASVLLVFIAVFAHPKFRVSHHNSFETIHRFAGWLSLGLLWAQLGATILNSRPLSGESVASLMANNPLFWCLAIISIAIIYPWTRLRKRDVHVQVLSSKAALLHFTYRRMDICQGIRITDSPLRETHSFATISSDVDEQGFRVLMSRAGDWTSKFIDNPPTSIWVKGAPIFGVMRVALIFKKVLVVATGTGIGPCLSLMESCPDYPMHVLWMGSDPRETYGDTIINSVFAADSGACIVDTSKAGRGDILRLVYARYVESQAEAVIIISNALVTRRVVDGLESRGVPIFGAIFDS
jgi:hypothetical protein